MALSFVSVVGICIRGTRGGLFSVFGFCASQGRACVRRARGRWNRCVLLVDLVRFFACPAVRGLRLLAQQSEFFAAALRRLADHSFLGFCEDRSSALLLPARVANSPCSTDPDLWLPS